MLFSRVYQHSARARRLHRVCGMGTPQSRFSLAHSPLTGTKFPVVLSFQAPSQPELRNQTNSFLFSLYTRLRQLYQKKLLHNLRASIFTSFTVYQLSCFFNQTGQEQGYPPVPGGKQKDWCYYPEHCLYLWVSNVWKTCSLTL